jgi:hypothetical protein
VLIVVKLETVVILYTKSRWLMIHAVGVAYASGFTTVALFPNRYTTVLCAGFLQHSFHLAATLLFRSYYP